MERDEDSDGYAEGLELNLEMETNETIQFVQLFLIFSYELKVGLAFFVKVSFNNNCLLLGNLSNKYGGTGYAPV